MRILRFNESLIDKMTPKSDDEILDLIKKSDDPPSLYLDLVKSKNEYAAKKVVELHFLPLEQDRLKQEWLDYALKYAFQYVQIDLFEYLLENGADIESLPDTRIIVTTLAYADDKLREVYYKYKK